MTRSNPPFSTRTCRYGTAAIQHAAALIRAGQTVAIPTETVYGLAADATDSAAVARIYEAKGRPSFNPLIVHVPDLATARLYARFDDTALALAAAFWPGPLTLVLPRTEHSPIASLATAGLDTIAIRCPAHEAMRALLIASGRPLAAPSANASGRISPTRAEHVLASLDGRIPLVIDGGPTGQGVESTIAAPSGSVIRLLRPGPITPEQLTAATGLPVETVIGGAIEAPGQMTSHYAPSKPLRLNATDARPGEWLIGFGNVAGDVSLSVSSDLAEAAANLFDLLHRADAGGTASIAVAPVPDNGLGIAINDRLMRAAA
ncbi:L-threonylcarbamoyladenylate synthase [Sphingobium boeckii]|uniref:Threonylcarbamoyl-AMP synthase n=1 Tax=Sphingobium boeckii TaxID=1082345 RepID=A0A7W9EF33_9SPHN|nr:L-threonylcarbamoyladenylate synthase [Sphingobium boeckii]MBB5685296.1 L-threonylcarbamoyladenylate synthase [Sphingobium boeckii]